MMILIVSLHVKAEHLDAFREITIANASNSRLEPGVARFDVVQQSDDPTRFLFIEAYYEQAGLDAHRQAPHYLAWQAKVPDMLAEPRSRQSYSNVSPPDAEW